MQLTQVEQRIIGCLIEKQVTTPDQYPLSLNALANACNQKSNREPVMALSQSDILDALVALEDKRLVTKDDALSGRVAKYQHRFCNTEFGHLQFSPQQRAIICLLLLRGAQTPGELRTRSGRLADFANIDEVESALTWLQAENHICKLEREPGKRESRFQHLFGDGEVTIVNEPGKLEDQDLNVLLEEIAELKTELEKIKQHLGL